MDTKVQQNNILKGYKMLLYFTGSMIMYEPSEECVTDFWNNGILNKLPVSSSNPSFVKAAAQLRNSCTDKTICGKMLREDYLTLFGRQDQSLAPAFESLYQNNGQHHTESNVSEFYNSYGWESKFKGKINDDHLGIELLFLTLLIDKYFALDDEFCISEMKTEIRRYIKNHILSWIPEWNDKIQEHSQTLSYKGIGTLICACVDDIYEIFGIK